MWQKAAVQGFEHVAHLAATRAGALIRARFGQRHEVSFKGEVDIVTETDKQAEDLIVETITSAFPDHGLVTEESGSRDGAGEHRWYVDPLDGTTNFAHGYPQFAVSLALARGEEVVLGLVYDPLREERFTALRGQGARLNGVPIEVSPVDVLDRALLGTGFPYDRRQQAATYLAYWQEALSCSQGVRRAGAASLDLCYLAAGRLDAFWEWKLKPWDLAAAGLILEEAGGRITDATGGPHRLSGEETVASNGHLHAEMLAMIARVRDAGAPGGARARG